MASDTVSLSKVFLTRVAEMVNELIMEDFDAAPYATLDGYVSFENFTMAMEEMLKKPKVRKISKPLKTIFIIVAILALICGCALSVTAIRRAFRDRLFKFNHNHAVIIYESDFSTEEST